MTITGSARLAQIDLSSVLSVALADQARSVADSARDMLPYLSLDATAGIGEDEREGSRGHVTLHCDGNEAIVRVVTSVAGDREFGTRTSQPQPLLLPTVIEQGEAIAHAIAGAATSALRSR